MQEEVAAEEQPPAAFPRLHDDEITLGVVQADRRYQVHLAVCPGLGSPHEVPKTDGSPG